MTDNIFRYTLEDALEVAARTPPANARASRMENRDRWYGDRSDDSFDAALRLARVGDPDGALKLRRKLEAIPSLGASPRPVLRWSETEGVEIDVGRYAVGDPQCLIETVRARRPSPTVKIAVERAVNSSTSPDEMRSVGASVLAVVEQLRLNGVPTEIWVCYTQRLDETMSVQVRVQEAGRPVNVDVLAFWVADPMAFRRIGFALQEQQDADVRARCGIQNVMSYGYPCRTPREGFDEVAPAYQRDATAWIADVMTRRR